MDLLFSGQLFSGKSTVLLINFDLVAQFPCSNMSPLPPEVNTFAKSTITLLLPGSLNLIIRFQICDIHQPDFTHF